MIRPVLAFAAALLAAPVGAQQPVPVPHAGPEPVVTVLPLIASPGLASSAEIVLTDSMAGRNQLALGVLRNVHPRGPIAERCIPVALSGREGWSGEPIAVIDMGGWWHVADWDAVRTLAELGDGGSQAVCVARALGIRRDHMVFASRPDFDCPRTMTSAQAAFDRARRNPIIQTCFPEAAQ